ncbi:protein phosphatase 2C domain-containing protein [bacterium]|nr:protein phosphatase 2C domain-containing protein [bacterium]MCI0603790.1 protein phosphatase 2C domain-containing protein [bacterium]
MRIAGLSDIGLVRTKNEDAYWFDMDRAIFILADGLGGHRAGEVAANLAVKIVAERLSAAVDRKLKNFDLIDALQEAFGAASAEIYKRGKSSEKLTGMGCSLIAGILHEENCYLAHAGDSRAYLYFENTLSQMTVDDTPVAALIKRGYLLPEKARSHNMKNVLVKSIGTKSKVDANITQFPVKAKERLLLCSDGLWGALDHKRMCEILRKPMYPERACQELIARARSEGGKDNITVIIVDVENPADNIGVITVEMPRPI